MGRTVNGWVSIVSRTRTMQREGAHLLYEHWSNGQWWVSIVSRTRTMKREGAHLFVRQMVERSMVSDSRTTSTYDAQGNLTLLWHFSWHNSSWTPTDFGMRVRHQSLTARATTMILATVYNITLISRTHSGRMLPLKCERACQLLVGTKFILTHSIPQLQFATTCPIFHM